MTAIVHALSVSETALNCPVTARTMIANRGRKRRPRMFTTPYSATPDVAAAFPMPQPRTMTHRTPMFHGPNGTLAPMPARINQDIAPRTTCNPGMRATNTSPLANQAIAPRIVITTICAGVSAWNASTTSA
jgi:hypothetical protein